MITTSPLRNSLLLAAGLSFVAFQADAVILQLDFGPGANPGSGTHTADIASVGAAKADGYTVGSWWHVIGNPGTNPVNLIDDTGTTSGVTMVLTNRGGDATVANGLATGETDNLPITRDYLWSNAGVLLTSTFTGLQAGIYDIYVMVGVNGDGGSTGPDRHYDIGFNIAGSNVQTSPLGPLRNADASLNDNSIWNDGINYVKYRATITEGQTLAVTSVGVPGGDNTQTWGALNAIQIVTVPEPSSALLGGLGMLFLLRRRRN